MRERRLSQNERADRPSSGITLETFETSDRERDGGRDRDRDRARSLGPKAERGREFGQRFEYSNCRKPFSFLTGTGFKKSPIGMRTQPDK